MILKYLVGSKMLGLDNCRDEDWITLIDERTPFDNQNGHVRIAFLQTLINHFIEGKGQHNDPYKSKYIYQISAGFHDDRDYPFKDFNILDHKQVWIKKLKGYMNHPETEKFALASGSLNKTFYHILYQYYMIVENTHFISEEAKTDVQKIHDFEMSSRYFYELRDLINGLESR